MGKFGVAEGMAEGMAQGIDLNKAEILARIRQLELRNAELEAENQALREAVYEHVYGQD